MTLSDLLGMFSPKVRVTGQDAPQGSPLSNGIGPNPWQGRTPFGSNIDPWNSWTPNIRSFPGMEQFYGAGGSQAPAAAAAAHAMPTPMTRPIAALPGSGTLRDLLDSPGLWTGMQNAVARRRALYGG